VHAFNGQRGAAAILLGLVGALFALPVSSALQPPAPSEQPAETENVQDLGALEEGLTLVTAGKLKDAGGVFGEAEKTGHYRLAGVLVHLTDAYAIYRGSERAYQAHRELWQAVEAAKRDRPTQADYEALIRWTQDRLGTGGDEVVPPWGRVLHCHLGLLKEAALGRPSELDLDPEPVETGDQIPVPPQLFNPVAPYTRRARWAGDQGRITVRATIDSEGCTRAVEVLEGFDPEMARNAATAMHWWVSRPTMVDGQPVAVYAKWTVNYSLE
jgi:hypothetical protein